MTAKPTKTLRTTKGQLIEVYDDCFSYAQRSEYLTFFQNSLFKTTGYDNNDMANRGDFNLVSSYSELDIANLGMLSAPELADIVKGFDGMQLLQARVNLSTLSDKNRVHIDSINGKTLLYYPNLEWKLEWGGMTMFTTDDQQELEFCLAYKPGRVVIFDGDIPHCICAPTNLAPTYRFSFAIQFKKGDV